MTTLTLTPDPGNGYTRLTITPTGDVTRVRRSDVNGTADVRTMMGQLPHLASEGVLILDDYEAVHGTASYTVTTTADTVAGAAVLALESPWLGTPEAPQFSARVPSVVEYATGTTTRSTVHEPDGREDAIVIVLGSSSRRGSMMVEAGDYPTALNLLRLCQRGQTMLLRQLQHPGMDMYFLPMQADIVTSLAAGSRSLFDLSIQYIETGRPTGYLAGALGWTYDALAADFPTYEDMAAAYASYGDLRTDVRTP